VDRLKQAEAAAKDAGAAMRARRFEPIATQAVSLWEQLRLQSNVELTSIELSGAGTSRRVDLEVRVDGTEGAALGVVSQGEINCLALSLFFPRATLPESPFRFLVIDDPVQAMDPARVDGLAKVFADMAADRQVIVFTHDDRLPESLRRLGLAHTAKEVTRRPGSVVSVRDKLDPVVQYFRDAWAVAKDDQLPDGVASRVVPGMCRLGLEAAFTEKARRRLLGGGQSHVSTEETIGSARTLTEIAALAMFGDTREGKRVMPTLDGIDRNFANVFRDCNEGAHRGFGGSLTDLVNTAGALAERARA
jgi:ABC-type lipoprotein export system ATPase subunit